MSENDMLKYEFALMAEYGDRISVAIFDHTTAQVLLTVSSRHTSIQYHMNKKDLENVRDMITKILQEEPSEEPPEICSECNCEPKTCNEDPDYCESCAREAAAADDFEARREC